MNDNVKQHHIKFSDEKYQRYIPHFSPRSQVSVGKRFILDIPSLIIRNKMKVVGKLWCGEATKCNPKNNQFRLVTQT